MMPLEDSVIGKELYVRKRVKWYKAIWLFITGKKNEIYKWEKIKRLGDK